MKLQSKIKKNKKKNRKKQMLKQCKKWNKNLRMKLLQWKNNLLKLKKSWKPNKNQGLKMIQKPKNLKLKSLKRKQIILSFNKKKWKNFCRKDSSRNNYKLSITELRSNLIIYCLLLTKLILLLLSSKEISNLTQSL